MVSKKYPVIFLKIKKLMINDTNLGIEDVLNNL